MYIMTVNTTKFWCLLKQHVLTHIGHLQAKYMYKHLKVVYVAFYKY